MPRFITPKKLSITPGIIPKITFKLFGDWDKTIRILQKIGPDVKSASIKAQMKVGNEVCKKVKQHLRNQDLGWPRLDEKYLSKKRRAGMSGKTLYGYGNYYNAIEVWKSGNNHLINIGVKKGKYTKDLRGKRSRLEIAQIAAIHEFSSGRKIPRRELWNPTFKEMGGIKGLRKMYVNSLMHHLSRMGIPVKQYRKFFN